MVDLGRPEQYGGSDGVVELIEIHSAFAAGPAVQTQFDVLTTDEAKMLYRVRFVSVFGQLSAGAGGLVLTFQGLTTPGSGPSWPQGGPLVAASDTEVLANERFHYTWNTEISDNYSNLDADFGRVWVGGLPLVYLPQDTVFSVLLTAKGGYAGDYQIDGGHMQIERFQADKVLGTLDLANIYLLPQNQ